MITSIFTFFQSIWSNLISLLLNLDTGLGFGFGFLIIVSLVFYAVIKYFSSLTN